MHVPRPVVERIARYVVRPWLRTPVWLRRPAVEILSRATRVPGGVAIVREARGGVPGDLVAPKEGAGRGRIIYFHGGAYETGSPRTHRHVIATLALRSGHAVFAPDYRLSPEHPAPAALEDAIAVYEAMASDSESPVALAGDSAGGGLAIALAVAARDRGLPAPSRLALISPWVDLTMSGASLIENERGDALLSHGSMVRSARGYAATLGREHPICSPVRADLAGLPPMLIHAGANELLVSEDKELAHRAQAAGVDVELRVFPDLWHDFHVHAGMLHEADQALGELGEFLGAGLTQSPALQ